VAAQRSAGGVTTSRSARPEGAFARWLNRRIPAASQVRLDHRRIFILPSRAGLGMLFLLMIMLLGAINYQNSLVYAVTFILGSLFWVALHHTYRNLAGLQLQSTGSRSVFAGEAAPLELKLRGGRREHQSISLRWRGTPERRVDVPTKGEKDTTLYHPTHRRGWFRPGRLRIETRYPLGWFVAWSLVDLHWQVLVYPRPIEAELPRQNRNREGEGDNPRGEGVEDFQGLRDYQPGDSKRRLDWRAWSRGQGLHSKVFAEPTQSNIWLSLDDAPAMDLEGRLGCLTGWILQLDQSAQPYGLLLGSTRLEPSLGEKHREACLRALALYQEGT
jgi:uncharacterized protein (DUF58 family)